MFTFTQSVVTSKNVSQGTHHVRKSSRPSPSVFPPTHLIVGARNCVRRRPGFEATSRAHVPTHLIVGARNCVTEGGGLVSRLLIMYKRTLQ